MHRLLKTTCLSLLLGLLIPLTLTAQTSTLKVERLPIDNPLEKEAIRAILKDRLGVMWFGTSYGLAKYDGYRYSFFRHDIDDSTTLVNNYIDWIIEDKELPVLWIGTDGGVSRFDQRTETFYNYPGFQVTTLDQDKEGMIWIGTLGRYLIRLDPTTHQTKTYRNPAYDNIAQADWIPAVWVDGNGDVWSGSGPTVKWSRLDPATEQITPMQEQIGNSLQGFWASTKDKAGNIIFFTQEGIMRYTAQTRQLAPLPFDKVAWEQQMQIDWENGSINGAMVDSKGRLWWGTFQYGLFMWDIAQDKFYHIPYDPKDDSGLSAPLVWYIFEGAMERMWIGLWAGGYNVIDPLLHQIQFEDFSTIPEVEASNANYFVESADGSIWVSLRQGIAQFSNPDMRYIKSMLLDRNSMADDNNLPIFSFPNGTLWIKNQNGQLQQLDPQTQEIRPIPTEKLPARWQQVMGIYHGQAGRLWLFDGTEWCIYDRQSDQLTTCYAMADFADWKAPLDSIVRSNSSRKIIEESSTVLWVTYQKGVLRLDFQTKTIREYPFMVAHAEYPRMNGLLLDQGGDLWITTEDMGLFQLTAEQQEQETPNVRHWQESNSGLISNINYGIVEDDRGYIWISSSAGFSRLDPANAQFKNYAQHEFGGMIPFAGEPLKAKNGMLFFPGKRGMVYFHPDSLKENTAVPPMLISNFFLSNEQVPVRGTLADTMAWESPLQQHISFTEAITLPYWQSDMTFEFAALNYTQPEKNQYAYRMLGYNEEWIYTDAGNRRAIFTNLDPGKYTFEVKAANNDGSWNEAGTSIAVTITPPWWQTTMAYAFYVLIFGLAIWGFMRRQTAQQRKKIEQQEVELARKEQLNQSLQKLDKLKDQFLANTSHELRTPLNGIVGLAESLMDGIAGPLSRKAVLNLQMIASSGKRLTNLVNDLLDFSKLKNEDLTLQSRPVDLRAVTNVVLSLTQPLVGDKDLQLVNAVPADLPLVHADENRLQQILFNLIGNGIKFTEKGQVKVGAVYEPEDPGQISVFVEDTGIGIPAEQQGEIFQEFKQADGSIARTYGGTGLGLTVTKQLVELHGGEINVVSVEKEGSRFTFTLPISTADRDTADLPPTTAPTEEALSEVKAGLGETDQPVEAIVMPSVMRANEQTRILIVDDEPVNLQVLDNHLSLQGYQVTKAGDGMRALEILASGERFDMIILDIMMPKMSGYEVCENLREMFLPNELPVVMLTAKNRVSDLMEGFDAGANDYLTKPFSKNELLSRIKTHINLHRYFSAAGKFVPYAFLRTIGRDSITEVRLGDLTQREVTVFFSDIRGYTSLSESMSPEETFKFVNAYNRRMGPIIQAHHGFVNQYLGDGIMAIFTRGPKDALLSAISMQQALHEYNAQRQAQNRQVIRVGTGMHTGQLIMGIIGDSQRMDPATIADTVNTAARIEGLTKFYGVNILLSGETLRQIAEADSVSSFSADELADMDLDFGIRYLGPVLVKGKHQPIELYECFDGDAPDIVSLKQQTLQAFHQGMSAYFTKNFSLAATIMESILDQNPQDHTAQLFFDKASACLNDGVPEDWTGVEVMTFK